MITCKDNINIQKSDHYELYESMKKIEKFSNELEKGKKEIMIKLNRELIEMDMIINKMILCEDCREKKNWSINSNKGIARFLYERKLNTCNNNYKYIQWILFSKFGNIEYLAKGNFGEVHKATWISHKWSVVLKRIYI